MPNPVAKWDTTMGSFDVELFLDQMPITASNFVDLAQTGFYNGTRLLRRLGRVEPTGGAQRPRGSPGYQASTSTA